MAAVTHVRHPPIEPPDSEVGDPQPGSEAPAAGPLPGGGRPRIDGKLLAVGDRRLTLRGVTYGTFAPAADGGRFPSQATVEADFAAMAAAGVNAVRVYTPPPCRLLDAAYEHGLWILAGLPWEQHVAFLADRATRERIRASARAAVAACAGHPALLAYAVGNEVPAGIVRWHGRRRVEHFLDGLCELARAADPGTLVAYVSYPSTEYLRVRAADLVAFNVYVEDDRRFRAYLARLQNVAGERPLLLAEVGRDSLRSGLEGQARALRAQLAAAYEQGCAGAFAFAWTDEWHRGEDEVLDWDFGLTDRDRAPKPALAAARAAFAAAPVPPGPHAPSVSVVVCTRDGAATLRDCLEGVAALRYPDFEAIVIDDGSIDDSAALARGLGARVISTPNCGLSAARNAGLEAATGEIVAYLDDDARPDPDWLTYLAATFERTAHTAVGGPNVPPPGEPALARAVAASPGGPTHVLLGDADAEHLPGCNLAVRRDALLAAGGFDPRFRAAGDDVDLCWRLSDAGLTLGFHPAALVWHRRRASVRGYWRQQRGYGRAEALLERKWPERYGVAGNPTWAGRLYGGLLRSRVYHGVWGTGAFQPEVARPDHLASEMAAAPEWYLLVAALAGISALGLSWRPLLAGLPVLALAVAASLARAAAGASRAEPRLRPLTFALHLLQPAARLAGRLEHGLVPWRRPARRGLAVPCPRTLARWSETWTPGEERLAGLAAALRAGGGRVRCGGPFDRWDLELSGGALGGARVRTVVEEHGRGRQLLRARVWPRVPGAVPVACALFAAAGAGALQAGALAAAAALVPAAVLLAVGAAAETAAAVAGVLRALEER
ncbi:MAG: hypothetical protein QOE28_1543 [Solirubrobacteraceae bacterium]|nr:hypothetical protein [Solirubrobacteraceae bacterium]